MIMNKFILGSLLALLAVPAFAQTADVATVIGVRPRWVVGQQKQCELREVVRDNSRGDTTIGALAGGAIGSTIGGNSKDRLVGGVVGALVGGAVGNEVGKEGAKPEVREVCRLVPVQMQQGTVVTFEYHGKFFTQDFPQ